MWFVAEFSIAGGCRALKKARPQNSKKKWRGRARHPAKKVDDKVRDVSPKKRLPNYVGKEL